MPVVVFCWCKDRAFFQHIVYSGNIVLFFLIYLQSFLANLSQHFTIMLIFATTFRFAEYSVPLVEYILYIRCMSLYLHPKSRSSEIFWASAL